jgi:hypothetical protein
VRSSSTSTFASETRRNSRRTVSEQAIGALEEARELLMAPFEAATASS